MKRHSAKDTSFEMLPGWVDRTIVAYTAPVDDPGKPAASFVMTRDPIRAGDSLKAHADRQLLELSRRLTDFELVESGETACGGLPALYMRYTWAAHTGRLEQTVTTVERYSLEERVATCITTTAMADDAAASRAMFDHLLRSVCFEPDGASCPAPSSHVVVSRLRLAAGAEDVPMPGFRSAGRR